MSVIYIYHMEFEKFEDDWKEDEDKVLVYIGKKELDAESAELYE